MKYWHQIKTNEEIAEACEDAADLLEGHWTTGQWYIDWTEDIEDETGEPIEFEEKWAYCIEGAMAAAIGLDAQGMEMDSPQRDDLLNCPVYDAVTTTLALRLEKEGIDPEDVEIANLPDWNDGSLGSEQAALDLLRETAKRMRGVEE